MTSILAPALPSFTSENNGDSSLTQYRPTKDAAEFNTLLPPVVEFIEGSSNGALALHDDQFLPINRTPTSTSKSNGRSNILSPQGPARRLSFSSEPKGSLAKDLYTRPIDTTFPVHPKRNVGSGLYNKGNTCFLNSALQCLLHTPPILHMLLEHNACTIAAKNANAFCMTCQLKKMASHCFNQTSAFEPKSMWNNLQIIAKHLRQGRQEDSHEFLRYAIDALQKSALLNANVTLKVDPKIASTTWIHKIFGGELRSRVHCTACGHNSDTIDNILDLSIDIQNCQSLEAALKKFVAPDYLKGQDKYKCEKCKKHVNAEKRFTINRAPLALTIQLKRFSPWGKKITHPIEYKDQLSLKPYMSEGSPGPTYTLYAIVSHIGSGPHSGHYTALCRGRENSWYELDDDEVTKINRPLGRKHAYMLFYLRSDGDEARSSVKRPLQEEDTTGPAAKKPFIPQIPVKPQAVFGPQKNPAEGLKAKIEAHTAKQERKPSLVPEYGSDEDDMPPPPATSSPTKSPLSDVTTSFPQTPSATASNGNSITTSSFYGSSSGKKRKLDNGNLSSHRMNTSSPSASRKAARGGMNPYASIGTSKFGGGRKYRGV